MHTRVKPTKLIAAALAAVILLAIIIAAPASAQTVCGSTYTVLPGDTLESIAKTCRIRYTVLLGINYQLSDPDKIWPGQVLRLVAEVPLPTVQPVGDPPPGGQVEGQTYIVRSGDTLNRIARMFATTAGEIRRLNPEIPSSGRIYAGQRILLPPEAQRTGFVGVNTRRATRGQVIQVNASDFPANTPLDFRLGKVGQKYTVVRDATTNQYGKASITLTIPTNAVSGDDWVVEAVTTELAEIVRGESATVRIQ